MLYFIFIFNLQQFEIVNNYNFKIHINKIYIIYFLIRNDIVLN